MGIGMEWEIDGRRRVRRANRDLLQTNDSKREEAKMFLGAAGTSQDKVQLTALSCRPSVCHSRSVLFLSCSAWGPRARL